MLNFVPINADGITYSDEYNIVLDGFHMGGRNGYHQKTLRIARTQQPQTAVGAGHFNRPRDRRVGDGTTEGQVLDVEEIVVRDSAGRARLIIGTPRVAGAAVSLPADDAAIWISDQNGNDRLIVTADGIRIANAKQRPSVDISAGALGATIHLYDSGNRLVWSAP
jgi:hypothetical protein